MSAPSWSLKKFKIKDLKEYTKNPRRLTEQQYLHLKASLDKFGLVDKPIVTQEGQIIGGHQRIKVLKKDGVKEIECWVPDRELSEREIEEANIRLNKNQGEWDFDILGNQFEMTDLLKWGFDPAELCLPDVEEIPENLTEKDKNNNPFLKATFKTPEDLQSAENLIAEIVQRYEGAYYSVSAGEL